MGLMKAQFKNEITFIYYFSLLYCRPEAEFKFQDSVNKTGQDTLSFVK